MNRLPKRLPIEVNRRNSELIVNIGKTGKLIEVLLIEDNPGDLLLTKRMLDKAEFTSFHISHADSLSTGIKCASEGTIDVILSDLNLPDSPCNETFFKLKLQVPEIPIVVLSGFTDQQMSLKAVRTGAQDYLIKGQIDSNILERSLLYAIERKTAEAIVRRSAYHDSLTGLPSRKLFNDRCTMAIAASKRYHRKTALMMLDLDHFKDINNNLGQDASSELLKEISSRLVIISHQTGTVCRIKGDGFAILISEVTLKETAEEAAQKILGALRKPFTVHGFEEKITASLGIAIYPEDGERLETLIKHADMALYEVKKMGGNNYLFYKPCMKIDSLEV